MNEKRVELKILSNDKLLLSFSNGSEAIINLSKRMHGIRFGKLSDPSFFKTAKVCRDEVIWDDGKTCIRASIIELLDSMML